MEGKTVLFFSVVQIFQVSQWALKKNPNVAVILNEAQPGSFLGPQLTLRPLKTTLKAFKLVRWWMSPMTILRNSVPVFSKGWKRMAPRKYQGKGRQKRPQTALRQQANRKEPNQLLPRAKPLKALGRGKPELAARLQGRENKGHPSGESVNQLPLRMGKEVCPLLLCSGRVRGAPRQVTQPEALPALPERKPWVIRSILNQVLENFLRSAR